MSAKCEFTLSSKSCPRNIAQVAAIALLPLFLIGAERSDPGVFEMHLVSDKADANTEPMTLPSNEGRENHVKAEVLHVQKAFVLDTTMVRSARMSTNAVNPTPDISIEFTTQGKETLTRITQENRGKRLAILVDGKIRAAPRILGPITGGRLAFSSPFTSQEADDFVRKLNQASRKVGEQIRLALEWIRLDGQQGSFITCESRGHAGWIQMLLVDGNNIEFDFPTTYRRAKGQPEALRYETASTLPDVPGAEEKSPFSNDQMVRLRTLLKKYDLSSYSLKQVSKDTNGVVVGAIESVAFRVPVTATEMLQRLVPELFSVVHGIDVIASLDLQTGNNK